MLSTMHKAEAVDTGKKNRKGESIMKPKAIHDCNQKMGGVDKNDAMIGNYSCIRKTYKWYTKVFYHFLEEGIFNAFIIYKKNAPNRRKRYLQFKMDVIREMIRRTKKEINTTTSFDRLKGRHFPALIPPTENKEKPQKRCVVCKKKNGRKDVRYHCNDCDKKPGLCTAPCFELYHTQLEY